MSENQSKLRLTLNSIICLIALVIIIDFVWPGKQIEDNIIKVESALEQYYNAGGNYHHSYKVTTNNHEFSVTEDFAELELQNKTIEYSVSRIFNEINWYKLLDSENRSYYSLRIYSGLVIPILLLIGMYVSYGFKRNIDILLFVLQVLLVADLIFLIL